MRVKLCHRGVYFEREDVLVISDLHLGYSHGMRIPEPNYREIKRRLDKFEEEASTLVLNGDVFSFHPPSRESVEFIRHARQSYNSVILILGNHEEMVGGLLDELTELVTVEKQGIRVGSTYVTHGHKTPVVPADSYLIGHIHPMSNGSPCYLLCRGRYHSSNVLVQPPFTSAVGGCDIRKNDCRGGSPLTRGGRDLSECSVINCGEMVEVNL